MIQRIVGGSFRWGAGILSLGLLSACQVSGPGASPGVTITFMVGSALSHFCEEAIGQFNQTRPQLQDGQRFQVSCLAKGSGDVVSEELNRIQSLKNGAIAAEDPNWPTLLSVDGDIYLEQLTYQVNQLFPGQDYIPSATDAPLIANSPMVFMARSDLAGSLRKTSDPFQALLSAKTHQELDASSQAIPINYVHTAPTRSNSGLQTLVAQFASVANKRPEQLTVADIQQQAGQVQAIQSKIRRYGISTSSLANDMVSNGPYWASVGSVYESSVIEANETVPAGQPKFEAIYPQATYTSNMRAILPKGPWVSASEKEAAEQVINYLQSADAQQIAARLGLRPGSPGVPLGPKFTQEWGVEPQPQYDTYRVPNPDVVAAMLDTWQNSAKKPSQVALVVDSSGSMKGVKLAAVQATLQNYLQGLGPKEKAALIDFDGVVRNPVLVDNSEEGKAKGAQFIANLQADGGTRLYDATLAGRDWIANNLQADAINAVVVLTDGIDSRKGVTLEQMSEQLKTSGAGSDQQIAIFTVGYGSAGEFAPDILQQIAEANSGYYRQGDPASIAQLMADLQVEF